jgi:hypothetical protein
MVHESWSRTADPVERTAPGRRAADARFERLVDPEGTLSPEVRHKMAEHARKAHFKNMALKSVESRKLKGLIK